MYVAASDCVLFIIRIFLKLLQAREERLIREIMAVDNISSLVFGPLLGGLADIYGRKKFCVISCGGCF